MKKKLWKIIVITLIIVSGVFGLFEIVEAQRQQGSKESAFSRWIQDMIAGTYLPAIRMINQDTGNKITSDIYEEWLLVEYPVFLYSLTTEESTDMAAESDYTRLVRMEGSDEDRKSIADGELEYGEDAMHLEQSLADAMLAENGMYLENQATGQEIGQQPESDAPLEFTPVLEKSYRYKWDELQDYESLVKAFYAVDSTTRAGEELLQADELLSKDMRIQGNVDNLQILIYHTHSQEMFSDSTPGDESTSIVGVGEHLTTILREQYGYNVMHYTESFDKKSRDYAYNNSLPALEQLLAEYPSIEVVIDLHRDAMPEARRLVMNLQGRPTAQFMFFNGLSRTSKGEIEYLENPYLQDNLAFSFQMQATCNEYYPGLARRVYLKAYRYNLHLRPKSLLIELGAQNNTVEEAMNACDPLAHVLDLVLSGKEPSRP